MFIKDYYTLYSGVYLKRNSIIPLIDIYIYFRPSGFECTPAVAKTEIPEKEDANR